MKKRFIDFYLDSVTKGGSGGGGGTLHPYKPVSGYTGMPLADGRTMTLSQVKNRGTGTFWYGALPSVAPAVGDKICFYGVADDDGNEAPFAVWGTISQYNAYSAYCYVKFSAYDGASYIEDGVQTVLGGGSYESDGGDALTVNAVGSLYPIKPPASLGYKEMPLTTGWGLTNLKNNWDSKNTNAQYKTDLDDTVASGDKVLLIGKVTDSGKTWPFAMWGTVNTTVKYSSYMYVKLATYDGLSIMKLDSTYDSMVGETHIYENGTYAADSGNSIEVSVGGSGAVSKASQIVDRSITSYEDNDVTKVGSYAFFACASLADVKFGSATSIGSYAFRQCTSLVTAIFDAVTSIGEYAFQGDAALESLVITQSTRVCTIASNSLTGTATAKLKIYVPDALVSSYKSATNWSSRASQIYPLSDFTG